MTEFIEIRGARENNVRDVSGKSSVVFDTIVAETQRQLCENSSLFIRSFPPPLPTAGIRSHREPQHGIQGRPEAPGRSHSTVERSPTSRRRWTADPHDGWTTSVGQT